jgi:hypothetical protein
LIHIDSYINVHNYIHGPNLKEGGPSEVSLIFLLLSNNTASPFSNSSPAAGAGGPPLPTAPLAPTAPKARGGKSRGFFYPRPNMVGRGRGYVTNHSNSSNDNNNNNINNNNGSPAPDPLPI